MYRDLVALQVCQLSRADAIKLYQHEISSSLWAIPDNNTIYKIWHLRVYNVSSYQVTYHN